MDALENIELYQNLIYISYAVAMIGLGLAVFFFFYFKIPEVFRLMTGRGKKEKMQKISEENFKTGKIRFNSTTGPTKHPRSASGHTGSIAAVHIQSESRELTETIEETAVLEKPQEETTLLASGQTDVEPETDVLHPQTVAVPVQPVAPDNAGFEVVEQTMLVHTDEQVT